MIGERRDIDSCPERRDIKKRGGDKRREVERRMERKKLNERENKTVEREREREREGERDGERIREMVNIVHLSFLPSTGSPWSLDSPAGERDPCIPTAPLSVLIPGCGSLCNLPPCLSSQSITVWRRLPYSMQSS